MTASISSSGVRVQTYGLGKTFGARRVLQGIDLSIAPGEFVAIVGRSGCGKSTLLRLLADLDPASEGAVNRSLPHGAAGAQAQTRIMFQEARLLPWRRVLDNVALGLPPEGRAQAAAVLAEVGLGERLNDWPAKLSGGQRQRVALARALVHKPNLLLLDEPLGALDALTRLEMHGLIERLWRANGFTALLVTHDVHEAVTLADRVILIEDGRVALDLAIDLPRPRARTDARFAALEQRILARVLQQPVRDDAPAANDAHVRADDWGLRPAAAWRWAV